MKYEWEAGGYEKGTCRDIPCKTLRRSVFLT